ncbi:PspC domain-containing protein [Hamadaea sp. NPDC051192]|uniref:ATP-binding protein n=1 Tax=Hamadaea sp. NPDC051192 TaxID=3154940 RepID=UPI0034230A44
MTTTTAYPPLRRSRSDRMVAGVAGGIAEHVRVPAAAIRVAFLVLLAAHGLGAVLYAVYWAVMRDEDSDVPVRREPVKMVPYALLGFGILVVMTLLFGGDGISLAAGWLLALVVLGGGLIWHQAEPGRLTKLTGLLGGDRRPAFVLSLLGGGLLVAVGIIGLATLYSPVEGPSLSVVAFAVVFALIALTGVGVVAAPTLWRTATALRAEKEGRIREQERAELAAMVHDQVLHTLALIQRNAADQATVTRLARGQERSLRNWLYKPMGSAEEYFAAAVEEAAAEVEDTFAIAVETVVVGDCMVDDRIRALVAATREALVNAARHAKVGTVSLYAEVEPDEMSVFVRDRGVGFDMSTIDDNRHGVRGSIVGRMQRHGGRAEIRSEPGEGTEVRLHLPIGTSKETA